ncbi:unnamed protein product [Cochlearia groenlandica]
MRESSRGKRDQYIKEITGSSSRLDKESQISSQICRSDVGFRSYVNKEKARYRYVRKISQVRHGQSVVAGFVWKYAELTIMGFDCQINPHILKGNKKRLELNVGLDYNKLTGFCGKCFKLTHKIDRCPEVDKEIEDQNKAREDKGKGTYAEVTTHNYATEDAETIHPLPVDPSCEC